MTEYVESLSVSKSASTGLMIGPCWRTDGKRVCQSGKGGSGQRRLLGKHSPNSATAQVRKRRGEVLAFRLLLGTIVYTYTYLIIGILYYDFEYMYCSNYYYLLLLCILNIKNRTKYYIISSLSTHHGSYRCFTVGNVFLGGREWLLPVFTYNDCSGDDGNSG